MPQFLKMIKSTWICLLIILLPVCLTAQNQSLTDIDGNIYKTVRIGTQVWMAENLKTTRYNNGDPIPNITDNLDWGGITSGAYCWYNNDKTTGDSYGALYNWYTVISGDLCPAGWHMPFDEEWTALETALGGSNTSGSKLKERGYAHWNRHETSSTNESGFTALPGGYRLDNGTFNSIGNYGFWWSSNEFWWNTSTYYTHFSWGRYMGYYLNDMYRYYFLKKYGFSVRCIKDQN
jgi:uncharacterized protein (TIGR02145 family)